MAGEGWARVRRKGSRRLSRDRSSSFLLFQIVFWSVALSEFYSDKNIEKMTTLEEIREEEATKKVV